MAAMVACGAVPWPHGSSARPRRAVSGASRRTCCGRRSAGRARSWRNDSPRTSSSSGARGGPTIARRSWRRSPPRRGRPALGPDRGLPRPPRSPPTSRWPPIARSSRTQAASRRLPCGPRSGVATATPGGWRSTREPRPAEARRASPDPGPVERRSLVLARPPGQGVIATVLRTADRHPVPRRRRRRATRQSRTQGTNPTRVPGWAPAVRSDVDTRIGASIVMSLSEPVQWPIAMVESSGARASSHVW